MKKQQEDIVFIKRWIYISLGINIFMMALVAMLINMNYEILIIGAVASCLLILRGFSIVSRETALGDFSMVTAWMNGVVALILSIIFAFLAYVNVSSLLPAIIVLCMIPLEILVGILYIYRYKIKKRKK